MVSTATPDETATAADSLALKVVHRIEHNRLAGLAGDRAERFVETLLPSGESLAVLRGATLGHAVHPVLTDLPLGCFISASILDLVGGPSARPAASRLLAVGLVSALPTAFTGLMDWSTLDDRDRRVGIVHAMSNTVALGLYVGSWRARRSGQHGMGAALAAAGATVSFGAAFLGGHLAIGRGTGSRLPEGTA